MGKAEKIAGEWVANDDMHPEANIAGRKFWAHGSIEGTFNGHWPTRDGMRPDGLYWHFPTQGDS